MPLEGLAGLLEEAVRREVGAHRGREVKSLGDGLMVSFSSARRALSCAVAIQRAVGRSGRPARAHRPQHWGGHRRGRRLGGGCRERRRARLREGQGRRDPVLGDHQTARRERAGPRVPRPRARGTQGFPERWRLFEVVVPQARAPGLGQRTPFVQRTSARSNLPASRSRTNCCSSSRNIARIFGRRGGGEPVGFKQCPDRKADARGPEVAPYQPKTRSSRRTISEGRAFRAGAILNKK